MKSNSNIKPDILLNIGRGEWHYNYNVVHTIVDDRDNYDYDTIKIIGEPTYEKIVESLIREKYSVSDELAILRQRDVKANEYNIYYSYCEECKTVARSALAQIE